MDQKLGKGIIIIFIANIINLFFSLGTNFLLPKYLSVESYAGIKTFQLYTSYVGLFHFGYVDSIYLKYGGHQLSKNLDEYYYRTFNSLKIFEIIIMGICIIVAATLQDKVVLMFALSILPINMSDYFKILYQATGEYKSYGRLMNMTSISTFALNMIVLFVLQIDSYIYYVCGYVILHYIIWLTLEFRFKKLHSISKGKWFAFIDITTNVRDGILLTIGNLASIFLTGMDRWFVKTLMATRDFSLYSFAVSIENFLNVAITPVTTTLYNYFCRENDSEKQRDMFYYVLIFATILPSAAFPVKFILEIFLDKYIDSTKVIFLLFAAQMYFILIKGIFVNLYKVHRKQKRYFCKLTIVLIIGFGLNSILYYIIRTREAFAIGTLLSEILWFIITSIDFSYLKIKKSAYIFLVVQNCVFLILGFSVGSVMGFIFYILLTIIMVTLFMRKTMIGAFQYFIARSKANSKNKA